MRLVRRFTPAGRPLEAHRPLASRTPQHLTLWRLESAKTEPFFELWRYRPQNWATAAVRYYFDFQDHYRVSDKRGEVCQTLNDAKSFADVLAGELAKSQQAISVQAECVIVFDESGEEVYRTPVTRN